MFGGQPGIPRVQIPCVPTNLQAITGTLQDEPIGSDFVSPMECKGAIDAVLVESNLNFAKPSTQNRPHRITPVCKSAAVMDEPVGENPLTKGSFATLLISEQKADL